MIELSRLGLTERETAGILDASSRLSPAARSLIGEGVAAYRGSPCFDYNGFSERIAALTAPLEGQYLFILALLPVLESYYEKEGREPRLFEGVLRDVRIKLRECFTLSGIYGTVVPTWFEGWFSLNRIALDRLQFEIKTYDFSVSLPGWRFAGGELVNVHIPGEGPLDHDLCLKDYAEAAQIYGDRFPGDYVPFHCYSWLLHPEHPAFLDPRSRILTFQADYTIFEFKEEDPARLVWRFTLQPYNGDPESLPARNSLEKAYRERLLKGGFVGNGRGIFLWKK